MKPELKKWFRFAFDFTGHEAILLENPNYITEKIFALFVENIIRDPDCLDDIYTSFYPRDWFEGTPAEYFVKDCKKIELLALSVSKGRWFPIIDLYLQRSRLGVKYKFDGPTIVNGEPHDQIKVYETCLWHMVQAGILEIELRPYGNGVEYCWIKPKMAIMHKPDSIYNIDNKIRKARYAASKHKARRY
jgi:hypothetical protein